MLKNPRCSFLLVVLACLPVSPCVAGSDEAAAGRPLVVGFERFHRGSDADPVAAGELLLGELGCTHCHAAGGAAAGRVAPRPAPRLEGIGSRIQPDHLVRWLNNPAAVKPGTTMPNLLAGMDGEAKAPIVEALTHYLVSLDEPKREIDPDAEVGFPAGSAERGGALFHTVGCVACHAPDASRPLPDRVAGIEVEPPHIPSVPLGDVGGKYSAASLARFLLDPLAVRPSGRMPRTDLTRQEAADLAVYLTAGGPGEIESIEPDPVLIARGEVLFHGLGCASCHAPADGLPDDLSGARPAPSLAELAGSAERGCLDPERRRGVPHYALDRRQREAIRAALGAIDQPNEPTAGERVRRTMTALNCYACHERGGIGGPEPGRAVYFETAGERDLGAEGRLPPTLTGVGAKLLPDPLREILRGKGAVRPYLATRMPGFGEAHAGRLAEWFAEADVREGVEPVERLGRSPWGRELVGTAGLGCIVCHDLDGNRSLGIPAVDLATVPGRLRPEWFRDYLIDPNHFRPGTRMPSFWPEGMPENSTIGFGSGEAKTAAQIDSIYVYLMELDQLRLPEGMEGEGLLVLEPEDGAIVFRTFMEGVGMQAVAVGFPERVHAAFDAYRVRWAIAWRGDFLNAESTWYDRYAPLTEPLGEDVIALPAGMPLAELSDKDDPWPAALGPEAGYTMGGYRLGAEGTPTFLYRFEDVEVRDRMTPGAGGGLDRTVEIVGGAEDLWFRAAVGEEITGGSGGGYVIDGGLKVRFRESAGVEPRVRRSGGRSELLIPVRFGDAGRAQIEMELSW